MDTIIAPLFLFFIFSGTVYYILTPFLSEGVLVAGLEDTQSQTTTLKLQKMNLYKQIREVEFVREMGLTTQEDFERSRGDLMSETAAVIRHLDGLVPAPSSPESQPEPALATASCPDCQSTVGVGSRFCTHCGTQLGSVCPQCGAATSHGDRFCTDCGRGLLN